MSKGAFMPQSILITGCSSGIGKKAAEILAAKNWQVFATARKEEDLALLAKIKGVTPLYLDYRDPASIKAAADSTLAQTDGKLYALFNNGGYGQPGAVEDLPTSALKDQFETNFFGCHDLTRQIIPAMRKNGGGRIIQCSSILGFISAHYRGAYTASKHALEALTDSMRMELKGTNIHISLIEPGPIATNFLPNALAAYQKNIDFENSPHKDIYKVRIKAMQAGGQQNFKLKPDKVVAKLEHALTAKTPKARYYVTLPTYFMAYAKRVLPTKLIDKIMMSN